MAVKIIRAIKVKACVQSFKNGFGRFARSKGRWKCAGVNEVVAAFRHTKRGVCEVAFPSAEAAQLRQAGKTQAVIPGVRLQLINRIAVFGKLAGILPGFVHHRITSKSRASASLPALCTGCLFADHHVAGFHPIGDHQRILVRAVPLNLTTDVQAVLLRGRAACQRQLKLRLIEVTVTAGIVKIN